MVEAGKYVAKALRGAIGQAKTGTAQVGVEFEIFVGDSRETIWWIGFLTPAALKHTLEKLAVLDFNGDESFGEGSLNLNKEVEIVVQSEEYEGKKRSKVAYINELGGGRFSGKSATEVKGILGGLDLRKEMKATYAAKGGKMPEAAVYKDEDIAF